MKLLAFKRIIILSFVFVLTMSYGTNELYAQKNVRASISLQPTSGSKFEGLLADQIRVNQEKLRLDSIQALTDEDVEEGDLFDFDGLYDGSWDTELVHPYRNGKLHIPDSLLINLSNWHMPHLGYVTSKFGPRRRGLHYGIDLKVQIGDPIHAAFEGKVRAAGTHRGGYGKYIVLRHTNGLETVYAHLSAHIATVGQVVSAGEVIALGGNTGRSTGSHLHFETRFLGEAINPADIFDFYNKVAHRDSYMFYAKKSNRSSVGSSVAHKNGSPSFKYHKVRSGDSLYSISRRYGVPLNSLYKINKVTSRTKLQIGQVIRLS